MFQRTNKPRVSRIFGFLILILLGFSSVAGTFSVATYNVENYLDQPTATRHAAKSDAAKAKIRESIRAIHPDLIALEEMGSTNALLELRASLAAEHCEFPYWEFVQGYDTNIHVAVLSQWPIVTRRPHTNDTLLLDGRRFSVKRGFAEVDVAQSNFTFTVIVAHLKSRLAMAETDEAEERLGEARALRGIIDARLNQEPNAKLVVLGDFNADRDSAPLREVIGRGKHKLFDTRPAERNGDTTPSEPPYHEPRNVAWTYFYGKADSYSRIDYILISPAMAEHWVRAETYIPVIPNWGIGSDHRPIVAGFKTDGK